MRIFAQPHNLIPHKCLILKIEMKLFLAHLSLFAAFYCILGISFLRRGEAVPLNRHAGVGWADILSSVLGSLKIPKKDHSTAVSQSKQLVMEDISMSKIAHRNIRYVVALDFSIGRCPTTSPSSRNIFTGK